MTRIFNYADATGLNVKNPVRHVLYYTETGRVRALTLEEVAGYLGALKGDMRDFAIPATEVGGRPNEIPAQLKNNVRLVEGYVSLPGRTLRPSGTDLDGYRQRNLGETDCGILQRLHLPGPVSQIQAL